MTTRFLSPNEARTLLRLAGQYHRWQLTLPPDIAALKRQIEVETQIAELFTARTGAVDYNMVNSIVGLKLDLDALYAKWAVDEA